LENVTLIRDSKGALEHSQLDHAAIVGGCSLETGENTKALLEPADRATVFGLQSCSRSISAPRAFFKEKLLGWIVDGTLPNQGVLCPKVLVHFENFFPYAVCCVWSLSSLASVSLIRWALQWESSARDSPAIPTKCSHVVI
jgi:hypothetical protein